MTRSRIRRAIAGAASLTVVLPGAALLASSATAATDRLVTLVGSLQSELGCTGDWDPTCTATILPSTGAEDGYAATFTVPAGNWEFKVALDGTWTEAHPADNVPLRLAAETDVTFRFDDAADLVSIDLPDLPGGYTPADDALVSAPVRELGEGETFYFVMTDRFENGDPANDTGGLTPADDRTVTGFDPTDKGFYQGGDIAGLSGQLDYIDGLGTTAIWLTPSFKNNPVQGEGADASAGYHGYWITDFTQIDPHLGTNDELTAFIAAAHARNIKVYFDIITNHTADLISYAEGAYDYRTIADYPYRDTTGGEVDVSELAGQPGFPLFDPDATSFPYTPVRPAENAIMVPAGLNDVTRYHNRGDSTWTGESVTFGDFAGLDDLMTEDPVVVDTMTDIYTAWMDFGIDGFRIDTVKHVNLEFWETFTAAVNAHALTTGVTDEFFTFGEVYDADATKLSPYVRNTDMTSVLDFAFQAAALNFAKGQTVQGLAGLYASDDHYTTAHSSASALPTFTGNHDMGRIGYLLQGSGLELQRSELAHSLMFLSRGQPVVYYGDEQGFIGTSPDGSAGNDKWARQSMFASQTPDYLGQPLLTGGSYDSQDRFDPTNPLYQHIADLAALRDANAALDTGAQIELFASDGGGVYAFARVDRTEKVEYVVAANNQTTAQEATFTTLTPGATYAPLYGTSSGVTADATGAVTLTVPALGAVVLRADRTVADAGGGQSLTLTPVAGAKLEGKVPVTADVADDRWAETSFSFRIVGETAYQPLGTAEDDSPRVFHDTAGIPAGTPVEYRAVTVDADGTHSAASTFGVVGVDLSGIAPPQPPPGLFVTVPGSHNSEMGCTGGDWQPGCELAQLTLDVDSGMYTGTFTLPAGSYFYKVAIGGSWDVNFGAGGVPGGADIAYNLAAPGAVTFWYDPVTHYASGTAQGPIVTLPGSFNEEIGCPGGDWQPACMRTWMQDPNADGTLTFATDQLPAGSYEVKVAHNRSWDENYGQGGAPGGANYQFSVAAGKLVSFSYVLATHILTIEVQDPPVAGSGQELGHWVDQATIAWPADLAPDPATTTWELYGSPTGGMALADGAVTGGTQFGTLSWSGGGLTPVQLENRGHLAGFLALTLSGVDRGTVEQLLTGQVLVLQRDAAGVARAFTGVQLPGVLDDLYAAGARTRELGVAYHEAVPTLTLWAPTAKDVDLHLFEHGTDEPATVLPMVRQDDGAWTITGNGSWQDRAYLFDVEVYVPTTGMVEDNLVTDPYSVGLMRNSTHSVIVDLDSESWMPELWLDAPGPEVEQFVDRTIYELHIRDFSVSDETVPADLRGTYAAFALDGTDGTDHLRELAEAGMNTLHLLPSFDIATIEEDRADQLVPDIPEDAAPDSELQQAAVTAVADRDAFNWGYDPFHFSTPEGSYASDGNQDGGDRVAEFRLMVGGIHDLGYDVVLDEVFNHTAQSGQGDRSVLDQVVPGYYHRLNLTGAVETSTCCQNIATEHEMAEQLMVDSVVTWAADYHVDGFRFDLMGHHSLDNMVAVREALDELTLAEDGVDGKSMYLYGEGWNFGEVGNNARFVQATQGQLDGTSIGAFNDRLRDGVHGGGPFDGDKRVLQGFGTGRYTDPNDVAAGSADEQLADLLHRTDLVRLGMAGNLEDYAFETSAGTVQTGKQIDYNGQPAGYATSPEESVNYVDAHDNETLYDLGVWKLPTDTTMADRIRMNTLSLATVALGQSPSFWHAGTDLLRSKSLDRDSYNSGDWFNMLDWSMQSNNFGVGLPPFEKNGEKWELMGPLLANPDLTPGATDIATASDQALDLLRLRSSSNLFTLGSAGLITEKVTFPNGGAEATPGLLVMRVDDTVGADADPALDGLLVVFNASDEPITEAIDGMAGSELALHEVQASGADAVVKATAWDTATGTVTIAARTVAVLVDDAPTAVVPAAPMFIDARGWNHDRVSIPDVEGVVYAIDGAVVEPALHPVAKAAIVTVTAVPAEGYAFPAGVDTSWTYAFERTNFTNQPR